MKDFRPATDTETCAILTTLVRATKRPRSGDFLVGFPWASTEWFLVTLEEGDFESLRLFWDSSAWDHPSTDPYKRLDTGLREFMKDQKRDPGRWNPHLKEIVKKRAGAVPEGIFLILASNSLNGSYMIIDGNHRAVAALWNSWDSGSRNVLPTQAWLGVSPEMSRYRAMT